MTRFFNNKAFYLTVLVMFSLAFAWNTAHGANPPTSVQQSSATSRMIVTSAAGISNSAARLALGPTIPPSPNDNVRLALGPTIPPSPNDNVRLALGPTIPPSPNDNVRLA